MNMLYLLIINTLDFMFITILWTSIMNEDNNYFKLIVSVLCTSLFNTTCDYLGYNFMIFYIFTIICYKVIYKHNIIDTILIFLIAVSIDMILQLIISLPIELTDLSYTNTAILVEVIILLILLFLKKFILSKIKMNMNDSNININIYIVAIFSVYIIYLKKLWDYNSDVILNNITMSLLGIGILFLCQIVIYYKIIKLAKEEANLKCNNNYSKVIDDIIMEIRRKQHDFINYKNAIRGMVEVLDPADIKNEIIKYMNEDPKDNCNIDKLIYISNPVIRAVIYKFICKIEDFNIEFDYKIENDVIDNILNYIETTNILSNLLNNAFEEVVRDECIQKYIKIILFNDKDKDEHHLIIINSIAYNNNIKIDKIFQKGYSSKQHINRGYGLYNVKKIIDSYNGNIKIGLNNDEFKIDIYFKSSGKSGSP